MPVIDFDCDKAKSIIGISYLMNILIKVVDKRILMVGKAADEIKDKI